MVALSRDSLCTGGTLAVAHRFPRILAPRPPDTPEHAVRTARWTTLAAIAALALAACAPTDEAGSSDAATDGSLSTIKDGVLTIATSDPAYEPWVVDSDPTNGEGFESAVAYAVADQLGFDKDHVEWTVASFDQIIAPGAKDFDFAINQVSISDERKANLDFSSPYYTTTQAVVTLEGSAGADATTLADLKALKIGAMVGTTSLTRGPGDHRPDHPRVAVQRQRPGQAGPDLRTRRRDRRGPADRAVHHRGGARRRDPARPAAGQRRRRPVRARARQGQRTDRPRSPTPSTPCARTAPWATSRRSGSPTPRVHRSSSELRSWVPSERQQERDAYRRSRAQRSTAVAGLSTVALVAVAVLALTSSPGWPRVKASFFDWEVAQESFPAILAGALAEHPGHGRAARSSS